MYSPVTCPPNDSCNTYACNRANGQCIATALPCTDNDMCTVDSCTNNVCSGRNLTAAELANACPARPCYTVTCPRGSNNCSYAPDYTSCGACTIWNPTVPAATYCGRSVCVDARSVVSCTGLVESERTLCATNVSAGNTDTGYFVGRVAVNPCNASTVCRNQTCAENPDRCVISDLNCTRRHLCETASCSVGARGCDYKNVSCPVNDECNSYTCDRATGSCSATPLPCIDNDRCTVDSCATGRCLHLALNPSQLASVCPPVRCYSVVCDVGSDKCTYVANFTECSPCTIANPSIPADSFCFMHICVDVNSTSASCASLATSAQQQSCVLAIAVNRSTGFYVGQVPLSPGPCLVNDFCTTYTCQESPVNRCVSESRVCSPSDRCETSSCDVARAQCVSSTLTQSALHTLCSPPACKLPTCTPTGPCLFSDDPSLACACSVGTSCQALFPETFCTQTACINAAAGEGTTCASVSDSSKQQECLWAVGNNTRYCYVSPKPNACPLGDFCLSYVCTNNASDPSVGQCVSKFASCPASSNKCEKPVCANGACGAVPLTEKEQSALCSDGNGCTDDICDVATGNCSNPLTVPLPTVCAQCTPTSCSGSTPCSPVLCFKFCEVSAGIVDLEACRRAVTANGTYCESRPVICPAGDVCTSWSCDPGTGRCVSAPAQVCDNSDPCRIGQCSVAANRCVFSDPCASVSFGAQPCLQPKCQANASAPSGFLCFGPSSPPRDCTDYLCKADGVQSQIVIGADAKAAFEAQITGGACSPILCTEDSCDPSTIQGCRNGPLSCRVPSSEPCNASVGCYEVGNAYAYPPGVCIKVTVQSLIDFCGNCLGDNVACFFAAVNTAAVAGGIAGGAVAGIVAGVVIAALIAAYASRKGYEYYRAQSQLNSAGAYNNPYFTQNTNAGEMPSNTAR